MKKNNIIIFILGFYFVTIVFASAQNSKPLRGQAAATMRKAVNYFRHEVATNGGYLFSYKSDFTMREGEEIASPSTIWVQPPGTPAVGLALLEAWEATGDTVFLNCAISAARALVWGQLATGGWDYLINFNPAESRKWHYRRDVEKGDTVAKGRRNISTLDDATTQSALRLLMKVDKILDYKNAEIHNSALYCLNALLAVQYPNGAWPQRFQLPSDSSRFPVIKAHYPDKWSREYPNIQYDNYYTFNDETISDVITIMIEAYKTYDDKIYLDAAKKCGDFIILAQMPDPQPAWAQQYNLNMEPAWARKFEPPSVTGSESFGVMRTLLNLYIETGEEKFLEPIPKALDWAEKSLLPDKQLARFYELETNRPLYFNSPRQYSNLREPAFPLLKDYTLIYEDTDLPNHYAFKVPGTALIETIRNEYDLILEKSREAIIKDRSRINNVDPERVQQIIGSIDEKGRWLENGKLKTGDPGKPYVNAEIVSCQTFIINLTLLSGYLKNTK